MESLLKTSTFNSFSISIIISSNFMLLSNKRRQRDKACDEEEYRVSTKNSRC
ncbi:hypothetical protein HanIR_Chr17g0852341 [Helianthus annuus]|nr:hypothetical protein HanIR_Chr17g0852341 [Helianthus annuus]